jgi:hypothetical protein
MHMNARYLAIALITAFLVLSCEQGEIGIFSSIEQEELIKKGNLSENAAPVGMTRRGNTYYVALAGGIYQRDAREDGADIDWDGPADPPSGLGSNPYILDMVDFDGTIYVSYVSDDGREHGLFTYDPGNESWSDNLYADKQITRLLPIDTDGDGTANQLFASAGDTAPFSLLREQVEVVSDAGTRIADGTHDGTEYIFISSSAVYSGTDVSAGGLSKGVPSSWSGDSAPGSSGLSGILYDPVEGHVFVGSSNGTIYRYDGADWNSAGMPDSDRPTDFAVFEEIDGDARGVVVGVSLLSDSSGGYLEIPGSNLDNLDGPTGANYDSAEVDDAAIQEFYVDSNADPQLLFALTGGTGLWRARYATSGGAPQDEPFWSWE